MTPGRQYYRPGMTTYQRTGVLLEQALRSAAAVQRPVWVFTGESEDVQTVVTVRAQDHLGVLTVDLNIVQPSIDENEQLAGELTIWK